MTDKFEKDFFDELEKGKKDSAASEEESTLEPPEQQEEGESGIGHPLCDHDYGGKKGKRKETEIAREVLRRLNRPVAALMSGDGRVCKLWSYHPSFGWMEDHYIRHLADEILQSSGNRIIGIVANAYAITPEMLNESCFLERIPAPEYADPFEAMYRGSWRPLRTSTEEVYFSDGIYNLRENTFTPYGNRVIWGPLITIPYDPDAADSHFTASVERHFVGRPDELRRFKQECGKLLQPHIPNKYEVYILSHTKDNGKSTLMNAIASAPAGKSGMSTISQKSLAEDQFALAGLLNKFCNVSSDSGTTKRWGETLLKLTSGPVALRFMHKEPFSATLTAKLWNTANVMQELDDSVGNMSNRVKIFEFYGAPYERAGKHGEDAPMCVDYWLSKEMRQAIVAWMFDGLWDLYTNGQQVESKVEREKHLNEADPVRARYLEHVQVTGNAEDFVASEELLALLHPDEYRESPVKASIDLSRRMRTLFNLEPVQKRIDEKRKRGYSGITVTQK